MSPIALPPMTMRVLAVATALLVGAASVYQPPLALVAVGAILVAASLAAPTAAWVGATLAVVLLIRIPVGAGVLPEAAVQLPVLMAWAAFALALVRSQDAGPLGGEVSKRIGLLVIAVFAAGLAAGSEVLRPPLYLSLIATPFALLAALLLDPPDPRWRRRLIGLLLGLLAIQLPIVYAQTIAYGSGDEVRGTLINSEIGAHQTAAIAAIGAIWLALTGPPRPRLLAAVLLLATVPFATAANQVIFALPIAIVIALMVGRAKVRGPVIAAIGGVLLLLLLLPGWNSDYARQSLSKLGEAVKAEPAAALYEDVSERPELGVFGLGPAMSVSGASLLSIQEDSPLQAFGLEASAFPQQLSTRNAEGWFQRPVSSMLGLIGDLGLVGLAAFILLFGYVFNQTRRKPSPMAQAATAGLATLLVLGYFNDAFEQPPFAYFVFILAGLALTAPEGVLRGRAPGEAPSSAAATPASSVRERAAASR